MSKPRTIMIYGESGSTKTSQCYHMAKYIHATTGLKGRFIGTNASDLAVYEDSGMIERGIIDHYDIANTEAALARLRWLSQGYWPLNARAEANGPIIEKGFFQKDSRCLTSPDKWKEVGFYIIEGVTGMCKLLLNHMRKQDEGVGFKHAFKFVEEEEIVGGLSPGHYGLVQTELYQLMVQGFSCLPTKYIIWTGLTGKGEDKKKESLYGPQGAGQADTGNIPSWVDDCFHLDSIMETVDGADGKKVTVEKKVAWFTRHLDADTNIPYASKIRVMPEMVPEISKLVDKNGKPKYANGYVELGYKRGIDKLYEDIAKMVAASKQ